MPIPARGEGRPGTRLSLVDLGKTYGDFAALDGIGLEVPPGALLTLLGPSGCGKSTLLRIVAGFVTPSRGSVLLDGSDIIRVPPFRRQTAMVFQSYALFPHMRVIENVAFGLKMRRVNKAEALRRAAEALELVRLADLADRFPSQLSGGQQQRTALARALVTDPKVLLLDEPFGALDKSLRDEVQVELRKLQQSVGVTTICVTHDQQEAMTISDYIAVMREGRVEQFGTPQEIYDNPRTRFVATFIGKSNILNGVVKAVNGRSYELALSPSATAVLPLRRPVRPGEAVELAIRPQAIQIAPLEAAQRNGGSPGISGLAGEVSFVTNLGSKVVYEIAVPGCDPVLVEQQRTMRHRALAIGDRVGLSVSDEDCIHLAS